MFLTTKFDIAFVILSSEITNTQVKALDCFQEFQREARKNSPVRLEDSFSFETQIAYFKYSI